MKIKKKID